MSDKLDTLIDLVKNKTVHLICHYDADGVTSGALLYHLIRPHAKNVTTISKGVVFRVQKEDIIGNPDIIICADIQPGTELDFRKVIYVDHHPFLNKSSFDKFMFSVYDGKEQSCSLVIWKHLISDTLNPYFVFLILLGYFGDGGSIDDIPVKLQMRANSLLKCTTRFGEHNLMEKKQSNFNSGYYLEIQKYVSALNTGKRMHWSGDVPLELLKNITDFRPFIYNLHPIAEQLTQYKHELREYYGMDLDIKETDKIHYAIIDCDKNVQGVLAARYMKDKPIMIVNRYNGTMIASMRVPEDLDFDAGAYLEEFSRHISSVTGGGHEKAAGVTFDPKDLDMFIKLVEES